MLNILTSFSEDVRRLVQGTYDDSKLIHEHRDAYADLKSKIRRTAPNFIPSLKSGVAQDGGKASHQVDDRTDATPWFLDDMRNHIKRFVF
jgi:L-lactate utilization protein LutB